ncbi:hypothetical protein F8M41_025309 [Gigaspora margarita]|uniref:Uncharacterized protein n=1 Tax=Gigaspora margarita TaxID=4874 RepID=A0A8H3XIN7_GIGMA|nr:hypothetical protein F8M41_025309 [Gigaspora margarita]
MPMKAPMTTLKTMRPTNKNFSDERNHVHKAPTTMLEATRSTNKDFNNNIKAVKIMPVKVPTMTKSQETHQQRLQQ